jgi:hypothetical protein
MGESHGTRKRLVISFRDKSRDPARTEYMSAPEALAALDALAQALEAAGPEGDAWIRAGETVVVRASEVHDIALEDFVDLSEFFEAGGGKFWTG